MYQDFTQAIYPENPEEGFDHQAKLNITMKLDILRDYPLLAKKLEHKDSRQLNMTQLHDCLAATKLMPTKDKYERDDYK